MKMNKTLLNMALNSALMMTLAISAAPSLRAMASDTTVASDDVSSLRDAASLEQALDDAGIDPVTLVCSARDARGATFDARGFRAGPTQQRALDDCRAHSVFGCAALGCRVAP